jgi:hypothetical protein
MSSNTALPKGHTVSNDDITLYKYFTFLIIYVRKRTYLLTRKLINFILTIRSNRLGFLK